MSANVCKRRVPLVFQPTVFIRCKTLSNFLLLSLSLKTTEDGGEHSRSEWGTNENWIVVICPGINETHEIQPPPNRFGNTGDFF